jgi:hypothetical protein
MLGVYLAGRLTDGAIYFCHIHSFFRFLDFARNDKTMVIVISTKAEGRVEKSII